MDTNLEKLPKWKRHYIKRRTEVLEMMGGECVDCSSKDNLEIDHIDPHTKSFSVSEFITHSWAKIKPELEKCQLLCQACHRKKNLTDGSLEKLAFTFPAKDKSRDRYGKFTPLTARNKQNDQIPSSI